MGRLSIDEEIAKEKEEVKRLKKIIETGYDGEMSCLDWLKSEVKNKLVETPCVSKKKLLHLLIWLISRKPS